ncbi:peptidoglycan editing factor PgeF [Hazenella coriacea]|uniref:Purine nucleoside phosphorylase n=1 Tax=Hazenella coriacea TaxID=1179467 RepID=A0A4R3L6H2_9BACL|nr:peptidoglycan editing factor PgeF [Hazenella coriacea]TCS94615.1 hypothetical protein EDD58_10327 [Hazenella coriacea]
MEPFKYRDTSPIPCFFLERWEKEFPHLVVGFSARRKDEDLNQRNYAFHVGDRPDMVVENRKQLLDQVGMSIESWTCGEQVHGIDLQLVTSTDRGKGNFTRDTAFSDTDGLITKEENVLLASYYADCVPLYFYSPDLDLIGVAHAGWKGTVQGMAVRMVRKLEELGADPKTLHVAIGPSIDQCCYEVDERVMNAVHQALPDDIQAHQEVLISTKQGKWQLDLRKTNVKLLQRVGVLERNILVTTWCTSCDQDYFYSHRRDQGRTGRMVAFIGKKERGS